MRDIYKLLEKKIILNRKSQIYDCRSSWHLFLWI